MHPMASTSGTHPIGRLPSFPRCIAPIIKSVQLFGIMPQQGLDARAENETDVRFKCLSFPVFMCFAFVLWDGVVIFAYVRHLPSMGGFKVANLTTLVFHLMGLFSFLLFLHFAWKWKAIVGVWANMEEVFLRASFANEPARRLMLRVTRISAVVAGLAMVEHSLFLFSTTSSITEKYKKCTEQEQRFLEYFFQERFPYIMDLWPSMAALIFTQLVSFVCTAAWNFVDLFIILISTGICTRFRQLYDHMKRTMTTKKSPLQDHFVELCRRDYIQVCKLLSFVNGNIAFFVLLSCANNLYFICNQLLNAFRPQRHAIDYVYFWYSLMYLIGRTLYLFDSAARVHETARKPLFLMKNIPSTEWSSEIDRFIFQISHETVALSAMGVFNFTRELILTMMGAVLTFELVMLQLSVKQSLPDLCA